MRPVVRGVVHLLILCLVVLSSSLSWSQHPVLAADTFRQEIVIPFDTSNSQGRSQPIDIRVTFEHPCWAQDEQARSIRVVSEDDGSPTELESQIYDLNYTEPGVVSACNVVFISPSTATGRERYYVTYSGSETDSPQYPDRVSISEAYYYFAPIPGYPFQSRYYKITQEGEVIYGVASEGQFMGTSTAQQVTLFKDNTTAVSTPTDGLAYASYDYFYYYGTHFEDFASTIQHLTSKKILVDGNLMVSCQITSQTARADFQTTATYHYYYGPDPTNRRIYTHVRHQALKATQIVTTQPYSESAGNIAGLQIGSMQSPSISELNFGELLPYLHTTNTDNQTIEKPLDLNPDYTPEGIRILTTTDDLDLGPKAWISLDNGPAGMAYALIISSTQVLKSGTDETDGIQIKAMEAAGPGLLGLKSNFQTFVLCRNSHTKGSTDDFSVPQDYTCEFDAEFYTTTTGGYPAVDNESRYYHTGLVARPTNTTTNTTITPSQTPKRYHLTTFIRLAPTFPLGAVFSLLTGKNFSYLTAELYRQDTMMASDVAGRLAITGIPSFDNATNLIQTLRLAFGVFDWKNLSLTKKITFDDIEAGTYLVKVYKEHPRRGDDRRFIGTAIVTVKDNTTTRIRCHPQARLTIDVTDQYGDAVNDITSTLRTGNVTIAAYQPTPNTKPLLTAPCSQRTSYQLTCFYNGFLIYDETIRLTIRNTILPKKVDTTISLYDLQVLFQDSWGFVPAGTLAPTLTSSEMTIPQTILAKHQEDGSYLFENLYPAAYTLSVSYGPVLYQQNFTIPLPDPGPLRITLAAEYTVTLATLDNRGLILPQATVTIARGDNTTTLSDHGTGSFSCKLPPGTYLATVTKDNTVIGRRTITVIGDRSVNLITTAQPLFPVFVLIAALAIAIVGIILYAWKKDIIVLCVAVAAGLAVASLVLPWWSMQGSSADPAASSDSHLYLVPGSLITFTTSEASMTGDFASVPALFTTFLTVLVAAIAAGIILLVVFVTLLRRRPKRLPAIVLILTCLCFLLAVGAFYLMMLVVTKVGVGGVIGSGTLSSSLQGETAMVSLASSWGLDLGFYLCATTLALTIIVLLLRWRKGRLA